MHLKDELMPRYAELIYNGFWFSPEREMLQALIDKSQEKVDGRVRLKLYKGSARVVGRQSPNSLYSLAHVTFEEDAVYDQRDAEGFIKLNALRLRLAARRASSTADGAPHCGRLTLRHAADLRCLPLSAPHNRFARSETDGSNRIDYRPEHRAILTDAPARPW